jgi:hypothetical protein
VDAAMKEVRLALIEADVHFSVVKTFIAKVRERAVGAEVSKALNPGQQVIKIVNEELVATLGEPAPLKSHRTQTACHYDGRFARVLVKPLHHRQIARCSNPKVSAFCWWLATPIVPRLSNNCSSSASVSAWMWKQILPSHRQNSRSAH